MMLDSAVIQKRLDAGAEVHADGRTLQPGGGTPGGWMETRVRLRCAGSKTRKGRAAPQRPTPRDPSRRRPGTHDPGSHRHPPTPSPAELLADMPVPGHDDGPGTGDFRLG
jgi:hypothetical protein